VQNLFFYVITMLLESFQLAVYGIVIVAACRSIPSHYWRFSLHGLLTTITIAAVLLGLAVSLLRLQ
jgi:uncharacterized protein YggT (Ycf19 family)